MKKYISKYYYCFLMGFQTTLEYRSDFFLSLISTIFPIVIQISLWSAIYKTTGQGAIYGYSYSQMIMYTILVALVGKFLATGFEWEMNDDIKNGGLSKYIVRPINYIYYRLSCFVGGRFALLVFLSILISFIVMIFPQQRAMTVFRLIYIIISFMLAMLLNFILFFITGTSAFYFTEVAQIFPAISIIITLISGGIFPVDIFGDAYFKFLNFLPFKYTLQFPIDVIIGKLDVQSTFLGIIFQGIWVLVLFFVLKVFFNNGLKKYIAIGG